jgi:hypothetical protein
MGAYIYQNRYDFFRGITFTLRNIMENPGKQKDLEEVRNQAYARLMRDIPFCIEALKGGELKLDTTPGNVAGRLGLIAYNTVLVSMPAFPDLKYLEGFGTALAAAINDSQIDVWAYYDGYGNFNSLGELMERLRVQDMPTFIRTRNEAFATSLKEDIFSAFRAPERFERQIIMSDVDINNVYSTTINNLLDVYMYIWKCSGMDMTHPSYSAPPGTVIARPSRRRILVGGGGSSRIPAPVTAPVAEVMSESIEAPPAAPLAPPPVQP